MNPKTIKIMHLGIAVWPDWETAARKMWIWTKSIERFGYRFYYYGVGTKQWPGYRRQKVESQLQHLLRYGTGDATHVHYTDCCDCLMLAGPDEFETKYKTMGCPPMLVQSAHQLGNASDRSYPYFDTARPGVKFRYPCVGGYIMESKLLIEWLMKMHKEYPPEDPRWGDDCFVWYEGFEQGWFRPEIDSTCQLWRVGGEESLVVGANEPNELRMRLYSPETGSWPVIWHNSGGSANHDTFKDHMMLPMARRLGIVQ